MSQYQIAEAGGMQMEKSIGMAKAASAWWFPQLGSAASLPPHTEPPPRTVRRAASASLAEG